MITTGLIVRLEAKPGKDEELAQFLRDGLPLVGDVPQTIAWFAVSAGAPSFVIFDVFTDEEGRQAHLGGPLAAALMERANELLANPPEIEYVNVLAAKTP